MDNNHDNFFVILLKQLRMKIQLRKNRHQDDNHTNIKNQYKRLEQFEEKVNKLLEKLDVKIPRRRLEGGNEELFFEIRNLSHTPISGSNNLERFTEVNFSFFNNEEDLIKPVLITEFSNVSSEETSINVNFEISKRNKPTILGEILVEYLHDRLTLLESNYQVKNLFSGNKTLLLLVGDIKRVDLIKNSKEYNMVKQNLSIKNHYTNRHGLWMLSFDNDFIGKYDIAIDRSIENLIDKNGETVVVWRNNKNHSTDNSVEFIFAVNLKQTQKRNILSIEFSNKEKFYYFVNSKKEPGRIQGREEEEEKKDVVNHLTKLYQQGSERFRRIFRDELNKVEQDA